MKLLSNISLRLLTPIFIVLFSLSSCTKGDEPVPSSSLGTDGVSAVIIDNSLNSQTARTVKTVVGGDDNEDDDDSRDEFGGHR